jgi:hypothetical protein
MGHQYHIFDAALAGAVTSEPDIKLSEAAMVDNSNIIIEDGEVQTSPLRLLEGLDNNDNQIKIPELSYDIVSVTEASDTIVFSGTGSGIVSTDTIYLMGNNTGGNYNDGYYTVDTVNEGGGNTTIVTNENISYDATSGWLFFGTTEALKIKSLFLVDGSEELFIFTKNNIYQWKLASLSLNKLTLPYTLSGDVEHWSVDQGQVNFGTTGSPDQQQGLIACNGIGRPMKVEDTGDVTILLAVVDGGGNYIDIADHCIFYENYLLLGNVVLSTAVEMPSTFYNSDLLDTANFVTNDSAFFQTEGPDRITAFGREKDNLIIFKSDSILQTYFTTTDDLFTINRISTPIGCIAPDSIINDKNNNLYFFGTDKRFKVVRTNEDIANVIERDIREIKDELIPRIAGVYIKEDNRLAWAIPQGSSATMNNKVIIVKEGVWSFLDIEVSAFSTFRKTFTDTWDTIDPTITWNNAVGSWNDVQGQEGFAKILTSDYSGNLSTLFNSYDDLGNTYESYVTISTDLNTKKALNTFKRITKIRFYFKPITSGDTIDLDISKDNNNTYDSITSFSAYDADKDINIITKAMSLRAKSFRFKIKSDDRFNLIGMVIYFERMSDR